MRNRGVKFQERLVKLDDMAREAGWKSYSAYIASREWAAKRAWFLRLWPDCCCLACGDRSFQLHHTTYDRFGREFLTDLIPLCQKCHDAIHRFHRENGIKLHDYPRALAAMKGWSPAQTSAHLDEYRQLIRDPAQVIQPLPRTPISGASKGEGRKNKLARIRKKLAKGTTEPLPRTDKELLAIASRLVAPPGSGKKEPKVPKRLRQWAENFDRTWASDSISEHTEILRNGREFR